MAIKRGARNADALTDCCFGLALGRPAPRLGKMDKPFQRSGSTRRLSKKARSVVALSRVPR